MKKRSLASKVKTRIHQTTPKYLTFKKCDKKSIVIIGTRRGGTTFLADLINSDRRIRTVDQPLDTFSRDYFNLIQNLKKKLIWPREYCQQFNLDKHEEANLLCYFGDLEKGKYSRIDKNYRISKNRNLYKVTNGAFLIDFFADNFEVTIIHLLRHPVSQSISCLRNMWLLNYKPYLDSIYIRDNFLTEEQYKLALKINNGRSELNKHVLNWIFHNIYPISFSKSKFLTVYYEDLLTDFESVKSRLRDNNILLNESRRFKNSGSRFWSSQDTVSDIASGNSESLLKKYQDGVSKQELNDIQEILDCFHVNCYRADYHLPIK